MKPPPAEEGHRPAPHVLEEKLPRKLQWAATRKLAVNHLTAVGEYSHAAEQPDRTLAIWQREQ
jgi:hypothetical protein